MAKYGKYIPLITGIILVILLTTCDESLLDLSIRDQLEGKWNVAEDNNLRKSIDYYKVNITKSLSDISNIEIANFYAINNSVEAKLSSFNLSLSQQTASGFTIQGYGTVSLNVKKIEWSYTVDDNKGFIDQVTAMYTKAQ